MEIKALGGCCIKSTMNYQNIKKAASDLGIKDEVIQITDVNEIMNYGVMITPGLVINGKAVAQGRLLTVEEAKKIISQYL